MSAPPVPANERARLAALDRYDLLDSLPEQIFDDLARFAARACGTASAVITLIDANRQWFKSRFAFAATETDRDVSFCGYTILDPRALMIVPDARLDPRFADNPLVTGSPGIRFYAGAPVVSEDGFVLGTIAAIDYVPRDLDEEQRTLLRGLARQVASHFELRRRMIIERRALLELHDSAETMRQALVEASIDAVIVVDQDGRIVEFSPAAEALFGYTRAAVLGRIAAELLMPPAGRDAARAAIRGVLASTTPAHRTRMIESTARRADGSDVPVEITLLPLGDDAAQRHVVLVRDSSGRRAHERALRASIERFELVARATNDAVWDWDVKTGALWWSDGMRQLFGHPPSALQTFEAWETYVHPDDAPRVRASIEAAFERGAEAWSTEYRFRRADGDYAHVLDRGYVLRDGMVVARMVGALLDITPQRRTLAALEESERRYRTLVEGIRDAIFALSRDGEVTSANPACEAVFGWPADAWVGKVLLTLVRTEDLPAAAAMFHDVLAGRTSQATLRVQTRSGDYVPVELTTSPRYDGDAIVGLLCVARDITERLRLEERIRQAQKMEAIGYLSGGVAHDFNNLLTVVQCNATLLASGMSKVDVKERATEILEAAERAATLTRQLLLVSRRQPMQPQLVDVNAVVGDMVRLLRRVLGEDIDLRFEPASGAPPVRADVGMLEQVLLNLGVNARDAMAGGGVLTIRVSARFVEHDRGAPRQYVCVHVADSGAGIPPEVLPHIYEPFFTTKAMGKGTGLGLATVYAIVREHDGWIEVSSEVGRGTTFDIHFPAAGADAAADAAPARGADGGLARGTETLLVVEDEAMVRLLAANLLERCGYTVLQAASGAEALEVWRERKRDIRLVLTDLILPGGMNGQDLAARMRADDPELPVVYASGYTAELRGEPFVEGVNFLQKPYRPNDLAKIVRERLDRRLAPAAAEAPSRPSRERHPP